MASESLSKYANTGCILFIGLQGENIHCMYDRECTMSEIIKKLEKHYSFQGTSPACFNIDGRITYSDDKEFITSDQLDETPTKLELNLFSKINLICDNNFNGNNAVIMPNPYDGPNYDPTLEEQDTITQKLSNTNNGNGVEISVNYEDSYEDEMKFMVTNSTTIRQVRILAHNANLIKMIDQLDIQNIYSGTKYPDDKTIGELKSDRYPNRFVISKRGYGMIVEKCTANVFYVTKSHDDED
jgi:hypothetical protein